MKRGGEGGDTSHPLTRTANMRRRGNLLTYYYTHTHTQIAAICQVVLSSVADPDRLRLQALAPDPDVKVACSICFKIFLRLKTSPKY